MQPETNRAPVGPEQLPMPPVPNGERIPTLPTPEGGIESGADRKEQTAEATAAAADVAATGAPTMPLAQSDPASTTTTTTSPLVAADEDVIEKEWVDKAKQIVEKTKNDPHARANGVNELQKDYLKKRYGKVLGASES